MTKNEFLRLEQELISIAKRHNAEYCDRMSFFEDAPYFTIYRHNIPVLADVRMAAEKYGLRDFVCSEQSWGYVSLDFSDADAEEFEFLNQ